MIKVGIICEFNPIHDGHIYLFDKIREHFGQCLIYCIMSGNFTQRGIPAIYPKYKRAEAALYCGADAVFELPFPWCSAPAPYFARGGVAVAKAVGCDYLAFGSESGELDELKTARANLDSAEFKELFEKEKAKAIHSSESGVRLLNRVYTLLFRTQLPSGANNTLALEYLSAINGIAPEIKPFTIKRDGIATASASRESILKGDFSAIPERAREILSNLEPTDYKAFDLLSLAFMREHSAKELARFADGKGGFAGNLFRLSRQSANPEEFFASCADKKRTLSRVRRFILGCMCAVTPTMWESLPQFTTLLGAKISADNPLPKSSESFSIITKPSSYKLMSEENIAFFEKGLAADSVFGLCGNMSADDALRHTPAVVKE